MKLDPKESINNMGTLRVDVLDAADLPSADRNGYSDPYCKFKLNDKEVFKTKVQKKTLHPSWNEFFECPVKSRIGADFRVDVYDWDLGDKADYLGGAAINLEALEPFRSTETSLKLDGKSGVIRLKLVFKPAYVLRSRQGSSTFSGTFAAPGKIVGVPVKGVSLVGGGVVKGASFLKQGLLRGVRGSSKDDEDDSSPDTADVPWKENNKSTGSYLTVPNTEGLQPGAAQRASALVDGETPSPTSAPNTPQTPHNRSRSVTSQFSEKFGLSGPGSKGDAGTASFTIVSATGYPPSANLRVIIKQITTKGSKEVHKTKAVKFSHQSSSGSPSPTSPNGNTVQFDPAHESFKVSSVLADTTFQLQVKDHAMFGSDEVLGEAPFFVDDQGSGAGKDRNVKVGNGYVTVRSAFLPETPVNSLRPGTSHSNNGGGYDESISDSLDSKKPRRSLLLKKLPGSASGTGG
jgi:hypothetical protein